jgi:hypothetical protein
MADNIIRFPGFLIVGRNEVWKDCKLYPNFRALVADLPERDRSRTYRWHVKREGRSNYRAAVLASDTLAQRCQG